MPLNEIIINKLWSVKSNPFYNALQTEEIFIDDIEDNYAHFYIHTYTIFNDRLCKKVIKLALYLCKFIDNDNFYIGFDTLMHFSIGDLKRSIRNKQSFHGFNVYSWKEAQKIDTRPSLFRKYLPAK